ncbi:MAG TPA: T9SS type A sorting domain-containing protein, partial [Bacteroidia bacterium]|nr:T9SS type A sorting domain-containing protein [Bacteroidia bacterium]
TGASNGNWTLNVADILPTQTGTLRRWTLTLNTPNGIVSYSWSPSTGLSATNVSNPVATPTVTTTYSVTATDQWGCSWSGSSGISVNPNPVISVAGNTTVCEGNSTVLTASGADTYVWSSGGSDAAETVSPVTPTTYTVTGTDANGCIDSAMVTVNINANPTIAVSGFFTICSGSSTTLTANGADTYAWNTGATTDAETVSPASTTSYTVTGTDGNGCTDSEVVTVTVDQSPVVTVSGNTTICEGNSTTLTATGADFYSWSSGGNMASETVSPAATATFVVTGTATNNCTSTETVTVTVNSNPVITVSGNTIICSGSTSTLTASGADIYSWNTGGTNAAETVSPALTTIYTVSGMDANNCTGSTTVTVIVNENPIVTANATSSTVCGGSPVTLTGAGADSYSWTGGVTDGVSFTPSVSDTYTVTGTDANNCSSTASVTVNVNAAPVVNLGADIAVCSGPVILDAQNPGSTFFWDDASMTQTKAVNSSGIYWVDVTDGSGCTSRDSIEVTINANPVVTLGNDITQCGGTVLLDAGNPGATFLWNDNSTSQTLAASSSGTYYVTVTFAGGCDATDTIGVTINPLPAVTLSLPMDTLCQNMVGSITLSGESPANGTWSGNGVSGNNFTPSMVPSGSTAINYTFTDGNGCSNTAVDSFWVDPCSWIDQYGTGESILLYPNPTNGLFTLVINSSGVSEVSLRITNLQGQIVFQENVNTSGNEITKQIDISALANGAYFVEVVSDSGSQVSKVIKQQ